MISGTLSELKQKILGPVEYEATFAHPWKAQKLDLPEGVVMSESVDESRLRFCVSDPQSANPMLLLRLSQLNAPVLTFQEIPRSLEQVYLGVMAEVQMSSGTNSVH